MWITTNITRGIPSPMITTFCCLLFIIAFVSASYDFVMRPEFGELAKELNVTTFVGQNGRLPCTVRHLAGKRVSWIRGRDLQVLSTGRVTFSTDLRISVLPGTTTIKSRKNRSVQGERIREKGISKSTHQEYVGSFSSTDETAGEISRSEGRDCGQKALSESCASAGNSSPGGENKARRDRFATEKSDVENYPEMYEENSRDGKIASGDRFSSDDKSVENYSAIYEENIEKYFENVKNTAIGDTFPSEKTILSDVKNYSAIYEQKLERGEKYFGNVNSDDLVISGKYHENGENHDCDDDCYVDYANSDYFSHKPENGRKKALNMITKTLSLSKTSEKQVEYSEDEFVKSKREMLKESGKKMLNHEKVFIKSTGNNAKYFHHKHPHTNHRKELTRQNTSLDNKIILSLNYTTKRNNNFDFQQKKSNPKYEGQYNHNPRQRNHDYKRIFKRTLDYRSISNVGYGLQLKRTHNNKENYKRVHTYQRKPQTGSKITFDDVRKPEKFYSRNFNEQNSSEDFSRQNHQTQPKSPKRRNRREYRNYNHDYKPLDEGNHRSFNHRWSSKGRGAPGHHSQSFTEYKSPIAIYPQGRSTQTNRAANKGIQPGPNYIEGVWEPEDYTLQIKYTKLEDAGTYICQINTEPRITQIVHLNVVKMMAEIVGSKELFVMAGDLVTLACKVNHGKLMPGFILWYKNELLVEYSDRVEVQTRQDGVSHLVLKQATQSDSANYTCSPPNGPSASLILNVIVDERPAAMQQGNSAPCTVSPWWGVQGSIMIICTATYLGDFSHTHITQLPILILVAIMYSYQYLTILISICTYSSSQKS